MAEHNVTHLRLNLSLEPDRPLEVIGHTIEWRAPTVDHFTLLDSMAYAGDFLLIGNGDVERLLEVIAKQLPRALPFP